MQLMIYDYALESNDDYACDNINTDVFEYAGLQDTPADYPVAFQYDALTENPYVSLFNGGVNSILPGFDH